jgi:hypothetical protein
MVFKYKKIKLEQEQETLGRELAMKRKITVSILLVILLVLCGAVTTVVFTQDISLEGIKAALTYLYLAQDIYIGDGGLLSGQPCPSPCAFGIHIGETQLDQVIPVLENNGISRCWTEPNLSWSQVSCGGTRLNVQVDHHTSLVTAIWFDPSVTISLGDIIEKYGEPNYVTLDQETLDTIHPRFYWNSIRMSVVLPEIPGNTYDVEKTTAVEIISFSDENLYRIFEKATNSYSKPWKGYGIYQAPVVTIPLTPIPTVAPTSSMTP